MSRQANPCRRPRLAATAIAFCLAVAGTSVAAAELAVGSLDPESGRFRVLESVLNKTFADGTPVARFQIRYFAQLPHDLSPGFFLTRSAAIVPGACRTEATRVAVHDDKAWVKVELPGLVLDCGGLSPECPSCQLRPGTGWSCGCFGAGGDTGQSCFTDVELVPMALWVQ